MKKRENLINIIKNIEDELSSFENEKEESDIIIESEKKRFLNEVRSGELDQMLNEIQNRKEKKETFLQKLFKIF